MMGVMENMLRTFFIQNLIFCKFHLKLLSEKFEFKKLPKFENFKKQKMEISSYFQNPLAFKRL